jgi:hypothetical protein
MTNNEDRGCEVVISGTDESARLFQVYERMFCDAMAAAAKVA